MVKGKSGVTPRFLTLRLRNSELHYLQTQNLGKRKRQRPRLPTRGYNYCFGLVVVEFNSVHCHPGFNVYTSTWRGENLGFDEGVQISEIETL